MLHLGTAMPLTREDPPSSAYTFTSGTRPFSLHTMIATQASPPRSSCVVGYRDSSVAGHGGFAFRARSQSIAFLPRQVHERYEMASSFYERTEGGSVRASKQVALPLTPTWRRLWRLKRTTGLVGSHPDRLELAGSIGSIAIIRSGSWCMRFTVRHAASSAESLRRRSRRLDWAGQPCPAARFIHA
jgi:hypothetical protein